MKKIKDLWQLYSIFFRIGLFTFGGGYAMIPILQRELVEKRTWITDDDLIDYYAIGQSTPGIIAVNVSTFVGVKKAGILGGIIGTLGIVTPSLIIISLIASFISSVNEYPIVQKALSGVNVAVAALLTDVTFNFTKKVLKTPLCALFVLVSFFLVFFLKVPSFLVIISAGILGIIFALLFPNKDLLASGVKKDD